MEQFLTSWGLLAIFFLTIIESACIPIPPSELTLALSGALASEGHLNVVLVVIVAVLGETTGALISYVVGRTGGRTLVDRYGRFVLVTHKDLDKAHQWLEKRGDSAIFVGRLLPVIRAFISLVAGIGEMPIVQFVIFTVLGAAVWCTALVSAGYALGGQWKVVENSLTDARPYVLGIAGVLIVLGLIRRIRKVRHHYREFLAQSAESAPTTAEESTGPAHEVTSAGEFSSVEVSVASLGDAASPKLQDSSDNDVGMLLADDKQGLGLDSSQDEAR